MIIKAIQSQNEIRQIATVEAETWGMKRGDTVPGHVLTAFARDGGVLLGAYEDDQLVGFTLGWLGTVEPGENLPAADQLKLVSHMTGVLGQYRDQRIGFRLKLAQRDWALAQGLDLITWTYDPLESRNGYFNMHLLGCVCQTYFRDYYGEMSDQMNEGIPSDRFSVDWWITNPGTENCLAGARVLEDFPRPIDSQTDQYHLIAPPGDLDQENIDADPRLPLPGSGKILVEIPSNYQALKAADPELALNWRYHTRKIFETYFKADYQIIDFIFDKIPKPRSYYLLEKKHEN